jgi:O-antigen ligase
VWLLLLTILIMPFEMSPHLYLAPSFLGLIYDVTAIKVLGMIGAGWALLKIGSGTGGDPVFRSPQARLFAGLLLGVLISATLNSSAVWALVKYFALVMFMPFVLTAVQTRDDLRRVIQTMVVAMTVVVPYALWQTTRWNGRLGVGLYEPNYFAANLVLVVPLAFALAGSETVAVRRALWAAAGCVLVVAVLLTSSRGGYLGLVVAGLVYAYRRRGIVAAVAALVFLVIAAAPMDVGQRALATIATDRPPPPGVAESTHAHKALFWGGLQMVADAPIFGVGPQRFRDYSRRYTGLDISYIAHNTYLELAAEAGVPVLVLFLLLVATAVGTLGRAARLHYADEDRAFAVWADGLRTGLIGFAVAGFFISAQYEKPFWLMIFLSIVVGRLALRRGTAPTRPS